MFNRGLIWKTQVYSILIALALPQMLWAIDLRRENPLDLYLVEIAITAIVVSLPLMNLVVQFNRRIKDLSQKIEEGITGLETGVTKREFKLLMDKLEESQGQWEAVQDCLKAEAEILGQINLAISREELANQLVEARQMTWEGRKKLDRLKTVVSNLRKETLTMKEISQKIFTRIESGEAMQAKLLILCGKCSQ